MAMFTISTQAATNVSDTLATLNGSIDSLDTSRIDAVCTFFEYGTNSDLSSATRTPKADDQGIFADGGVSFSYDVSGLSSSTDYYYEANARAVRYDDDTASEYITQRDQFLQDAFDNGQTALWDNALQWTTPTSNLFANALRRGLTLLNSNVLNNLWSNDDPSQSFCDKGTTGNLSSGSPAYWELDIDLTDASTLEVEAITEYEEGATVEVNGSTIITNFNTDASWHTYSADVSNYTGVCTVRLQMEATNDAGVGTSGNS